jgi:hypothetical protein
MNEAQRRILQMLQDGSITADEAERLLDAVRDDKPKGSRPSSEGTTWDPTAWMRGEPDVDEEEAIFGRRQRSYRLPPGATVIIRQGFGPLTVRTTPGNVAEIDSDSPPMYGARTDDHRLIITSSFAPLTVSIPETVRELDIESKAGPVNLKSLPPGLRNLRAHCKLGPLNVKLGPITQGDFEIRNHVGPINVTVHPDAGFVLETEGSVVSVELDLQDQSGSMRHSHGRYGEGKARVRVRASLGPASVRLAKPRESEEALHETDEVRNEDAESQGPPEQEPFSNPVDTPERESGRPTRRLEEDDEDLPFGLDDD